MPLFSRARALDLPDHFPSISEPDRPGDPVDRDSGHILARLLREALSALEHRRFGSDEVAARAIHPKPRGADARDVEL